jgi:menaquinol-cytochrome c reductase cytochrome b/c subunit
MSEPKDFVASLDSDSRKTPVRVAFVTRRTSPQVKAHDDDYVMTFPEALFRGVVAVEILALVLVVLALFWNAPLEELADPMQTPNPAKAPWYFLGLQELLHYFPPVVAGVLIPTMVVMALIVIPYFKINVEAEGLWTRNRTQRLRILAVVTAVFAVFLIVFDVFAALIPTLLMAGLMFFSATNPSAPGRLHRWLASKPLSFWIMSWFLLQAAVLTLIGTFFRGPGWSFVMPWSGQI